MKSFDGHSHIGKDTFFPIEGNLIKYIELLKQNNIIEANVMGVACPTYELNGEKFQSLIWTFENKRFKYHSRKKIKNEWIQTQENPVNPYAEYNAQVKKELNVDNIKLNFVPLIHPTLDTEEHISNIISENPIAVKIHGLACAITPSETNKEILKLVASKNIPIIVHTDNHPTENNPFEYLRKNNSALAWLNLFEKYNNRGYITHGASLCSKSFDIINNSEAHILAIGPDLLIESEPECLLQKKSYLSSIIAQVDMNKIVFDIDYPFNINNFSDYSIDFTPAKRIGNLELTNLEKSKILYNNAKKFFDNN